MRQRSYEKSSRERQCRLTGRIIKNFLKPRVVLFSLAMSYFCVSLITITSFIRENPFLGAGFLGVAMRQPLSLLLGAACLLLNRSWSLLVGVLLAGTIVYPNIYSNFVGIYYAHGIPMLSVGAVRIWFEIMSSTQLINTGLAIAIAATAVIQLSLRFAMSNLENRIVSR